LYIEKKLNEVEGKEGHQAKIISVALENLHDGLDINRDCDNLRGNIKMLARGSQGYCKLKQHKAWFDEGYQTIR
jgi:hypothetical protein